MTATSQKRFDAICAAELKDLGLEVSEAPAKELRSVDYSKWLTLKKRYLPSKAVSLKYKVTHGVVEVVR